MVAYNINDSTVDDGEDGGSRVLQNLLRKNDVQNTLLIVTRVYSGIHLGQKRWTYVNRCGIEALERLGHKITKKAWKQQEDRKKV